MKKLMFLVGGCLVLAPLALAQIPGVIGKPPSAGDDASYLIEDGVLIKTPSGHTLSAVVVRKQGDTTPRPTAMLFFLYSNLQRSLTEAKSAADHGYVGMVADVRGKRLSPDEVAPYEHEAEDVYDVIDWVVKQPWSDGQVGMYGGSYSGFAQWAGLKHKIHPALKTIVPYVAGIPGMGLPMENNVFINANYEWAFYVTNNKYLDDAAADDHQRWRTLFDRWYTSGRSYRQIDQIDGTPNPWLQRWLGHPSYDAYWQAMVPYREEFAKIDHPILIFDGYYNDGQASSLHYLSEHLKYHPQAEDYLIIGPYDHFGAQRGGVPVLREYPVDPVALIHTRDVTFQWFDYIMKSGKKPPMLQDKINYEVMGANEWRHAPSIAAMHNAELTFFLNDTKAEKYHVLSVQPPDQIRSLPQTVDFADRSGDAENSFNFPDPIIQKSLDLSNGVAFIGDPLTEACSIEGAFSGELKVKINKQDFDFSVALYEVMPDGRYFELSYYLGRASYASDPSRRALLKPGELTSLPFSNTKLVSRQLSKGSRLLVIANVNKNRYAEVNYGTGNAVADESVADSKTPLKVEWYNDSKIKVPVWR